MNMLNIEKIESWFGLKTLIAIFVMVVSGISAGAASIAWNLLDGSKIESFTIILGSEDSVREYNLEWYNSDSRLTGDTILVTDTTSIKKLVEAINNPVSRRRLWSFNTLGRIEIKHSDDWGSYRGERVYFGRDTFVVVHSCNSRYAYMSRYYELNCNLWTIINELRKKANSPDAGSKP